MGSTPVYFYEDPSTKWCSQWYQLAFRAPLPTRPSIESGPLFSASRSSVSNATSSTQYVFECNETYMMYAKAVLFDDAKSAAEILRTKKNPKRVKALGRGVSNFDREIWDRYKEQIVEEGNWWKFTNGLGAEGTRVRELLLSTGDRDIIEASPYDRIWGIGFAAADAEENRSNWGQNLLGQALIRVRRRIRERDAQG